MNLELIAGELALALKTVPGMRVPPWGVKAIQPPAAVIALPERVDYDQTYGRGLDRFPDWPVVVLVGQPEQRASRTRLAKYAAGAGTASVKARLEAYAYTTCDSVSVVWAEPDTAKYAGVDYLAMIFHLDITGKGVTA